MEALATNLNPFIQGGLAARAADLQRLAAPSIRLTPTGAADATAIGSSRLGGIPDLPAAIAWPSKASTPMAFIAQLRLADLVSQDREQVLPPTGWLWFFYDAQQSTYGTDPADRAGWSLAYWDGAVSDLQPAAFPAALPAQARYQGHVVTFAAEWTMPLLPDAVVPGLTWSTAERAAYEQVLGDYPGPADRGKPHHRILGHADAIQDDMHLQCQLVANGVTDAQDPRAAALLPGAADWRLLLQVDSDDALGMRWASSGMVYVWIEQTALIARQFDRAWVILQSE